ncbi:putative Zinc finger, CCCH-type, SANT/Myb domain, Zinc finger, CHY-type [Plasmopara halstedii]
MADLTWQQSLVRETDAAKREWMALERRYHLKLCNLDAEKQVKHVCLFLSLSDQELPARFKGQLKLQMTLPKKYPVDPVQVDFVQWSNQLSNDQIKALNIAVGAKAQQLCGGFALRKLLTWIDNNIWCVIAPFEINHEMVKEVAELRITREEDANRVLSEKEKHRKRGSGRHCRYFVRGFCRVGKTCKFAHIENEKLKAENGGGDLVSFDVNDFSINSEADPAKPSEKRNIVATAELTKSRKSMVRRCIFFAQSKCRYGDNCKFLHTVKNTGMKKYIETQRSLPLPPAVVGILGKITSVATASNEDVTNENSSHISGYENCGVKSKNSQEWSESQQRALDVALKKYPATMDKKKRWTNVAKEVEGKSLNECIDRFKLLCELVRRGVDLNATVTACTTAENENIAAEKINLQILTDNHKITPPEQRVTIETEPDVKGTQIRLEDLVLHQVGTLVAHRLVCQVQCDDCPLQFDAVLSIDSPKLQKWCPRCSVLHHVLMRPVFAHSHSDTLAYVDTDNCSIVDVLPTDVLATCLECGCEALVERLKPRQRSEHTCYSCHIKLAVFVKRFLARHIEGSSRKKRSHLPNALSAKVGKSTKKKDQQIVDSFVLGQPLPRKGACDHYKNSYRWLRFQCCGKAFPCDVCHDSSDCPEANLGKFASRMICGLCSKEQSSSNKVCSCGNDVGSKKSITRFWEGGNGCRNPSQMSRLDKQKYRGMNKTESTKFKRVGEEAKRRRDHAEADVHWGNQILQHQKRSMRYYKCRNQLLPSFDKMVRYILAGRVDSEEYAICDRLLDMLTVTLPDCQVTKLPSKADHWTNDATELVRLYGFRMHTTSKVIVSDVIIWTDTGRLLCSDADTFRTFVKQNYGIQLDLSEAEVLEYIKVNVEEHEAESKSTLRQLQL